MKPFLWPLVPFWTYSPLGYGCAVLWNVCELLHYPAPFAPWLFSKIMGYKGRRVK